MTMLLVKNVSKKYNSGFEALKDVSLEIKEGEIFALLGPNGAGKTTLISAICGTINLSSGSISVGGHDVVKDYREARKLVGLVPQELMFDMFLTVFETIRYARGFYGKPADAALEEKVLRSLSLWDKKDSKVGELSGGMKRRVIIAKALMNEPKVLFLDEPTAGVDVSLRKGMWDLILDLKKTGTTIVLTTHYLEEAELLADRIGVIDKGNLLLVEEKDALMKRLGQKTLIIDLDKEIDAVPDSLSEYKLKLSDGGTKISYTYEVDKNPGITKLLSDIKDAGLSMVDLNTREKSLEEIFISIVE
jgi:ABC-2 type transport system ATP-binding protein